MADGDTLAAFGVDVIVVRLALLFFAAGVAGAQQISTAADNPSPFLSIAPSVPDTLRFEEPVPDFEGKDTEGRVWRSANLRGKLTVIDVWGTRGVSIDGLVAHRYNQEHPELQRFYEKIKNSRNIQVLTFCTDFDYTHAPVYMKQNHYTFPVIADWMLTRKLFGSVGNISQLGDTPMPSTQNRSCPLRFPEQWVINSEGQLSSRFCYWSFGRILIEVERTAAQ